MDNIYEINIDDLEKEICKYPTGSQVEGLPDGTDIMSLPFGYYKPKKVDDKEILGMK